MTALTLGLTGDVEISPALAKALTVLACVEVTGTACIRASLVVRDYLAALGFNAKVMPVGVVIRAYEHTTELHSLGIGMAAAQAALGHKLPPDYKSDGWDGHLVAIVQDRERLLIDASIGQARRAAWADLPSMVVTGVVAPGDRHKIGGAMAVLTNIEARPGYWMQVQWLPAIRNKAWRYAPEARPEVRAGIVSEMLDAYAMLQFGRVR